MNRRSWLIVSLGLSALLFSASVSSGEPASAAASQFVRIQDIDPTIVIDLRYAGTNNMLGRPIYPPGTPALVRASVALRLATAQKYLKPYGYGLKIWDAYRPKIAHAQLWEATQNNSYVADPNDPFGSMHTR
ncbi:MAG: M15 family metallopeptidase, partial [Verrucomicrobiota bacterium]